MAPPLLRRDCPRCHVPLVEEKRAAFFPVTVDACPKCGGEYLDKGEVLRLTGNRPLHTFLTKYVGIDSDSTLLCPGCGGIMDLEDAAGVKVDVCITCFGLWLDKGELDQLKDTDPKAFKELSPEKRAEMFTAAYAKKRDRDAALRNMFGGLRRR